MNNPRLDRKAPPVLEPEFEHRMGWITALWAALALLAAGSEICMKI